jgi:hypothetical protein
MPHKRKFKAVGLTKFKNEKKKKRKGKSSAEYLVLLLKQFHSLMESAKCTQEEKFSSRLGKELSLTVAKYVQNNLMDQLTETVKMKGTNNKTGRKRKENIRSSVTVYIIP